MNKQIKDLIKKLETDRAEREAEKISKRQKALDWAKKEISRHRFEQAKAAGNGLDGGGMNTFTTVTNYGYYETIKQDSADGETSWSINKNAKVGDTVLLYVCAPVSAIVATAIISDDVYQDEDINSTWFGMWFAPMNELAMLKYPISRTLLLMEFPDWRYWTQPRNSVLVRSEYLPRIERLGQMLNI